MMHKYKLDDEELEIQKALKSGKLKPLKNSKNEKAKLKKAVKSPLAHLRKERSSNIPLFKKEG